MQIIDSQPLMVASFNLVSLASQMEEQKNFHSCSHPFRQSPSCSYIYHGCLWSGHSTCATESHTVWRIRLSFIMPSKSFSVPTCSMRWANLVWHLQQHRILEISSPHSLNSWYCRLISNITFVCFFLSPIFSIWCQDGSRAIVLHAPPSTTPMDLCREG
jgi:hypothetical protein